METRYKEQWTDEAGRVHILLNEQADPNLVIVLHTVGKDTDSLKLAIHKQSDGGVDLEISNKNPEHDQSVVQWVHGSPQRFALDQECGVSYFTRLKRSRS